MYVLYLAPELCCQKKNRVLRSRNGPFAPENYWTSNTISFLIDSYNGMFICLANWGMVLKLLHLNSMRTTIRLVKMNIVSFIEPIRVGVRKNSLICKFSMLHFQSHIMIGLTNEHFMI